jgi:energy-coupling factor transporter ATP-binding protein EcfA2
VAQRVTSVGGPISLEALIPKGEEDPSSTQQLAENLGAVMSAQPEQLPETSRPRTKVQRKLPARNGKPFEGTEQAFIQHIDGICRAAHFEFPRELLETLYLSLKVRPFVVLAGPSGVGKSALAQLMAEACGGALESQDLLRVAVEAHWTDSRFILGRRDAQGFRPTDFYRFLEMAQPDRLYHVLLDEMNLAHVEYYFAQLLSAMESDGLLRVPEDDEESKALRIPSAGTLLPLLRLYGTINVDESTQVLSDKVIDRANVIEVEAQRPKELISAEVRRERRVPGLHLSLEQLQQWHQLPEKNLKVPKVIQEIWTVMVQRESHTVAPASPGQGGGIRVRQPIPIGHRIIRDIALFVHYAERLGGTLTTQDAIDLQIKQRILPKIRGDLRLQEMLDELAKVLDTHQLMRSAKRLESMRHQLEIDQFVTFWT